MKQYLIDTFSYNDFANRKLLNKIKELPDKEESIRLFSHLINSQIRWLARVKQDPIAAQLSWWEPIYELEELESKWEASLLDWINYLQSKTEQEINAEVQYTGLDGGKWEAKLQDIALQLNYHSIHHRAQIQTIIRKQGLIPDFLDYIGTVYRKL